MKRLAIYALAIAFLAAWPAASAFAHPGHAHKVMGTVTVVNGSQVEVKDAAGKITKHVLDAKTKIRRGKTVLSAADIKVGDRIVVSSVEAKDAAGKAVTTVTEVQVGVTPVPTTAAKKQ